MSKNFTKKDLGLKVCEVLKKTENIRIPQATVVKVVQKALDCLNDAIAEGHTVEIRNFGVFELRVSKKRVGRNPQQPEKDIEIKPRPVVRFKPGLEMKENLVKLDVKKLQKALDEKKLAKKDKKQAKAAKKK